MGENTPRNKFLVMALTLQVCMQINQWQFYGSVSLAFIPISGCNSQQNETLQRGQMTTFNQVLRSPKVSSDGQLIEMFFVKLKDVNQTYS